MELPHAKIESVFMSNLNNTTEKKKYRYHAEGYADVPGKGPEGETCKSCRFSACRKMSRNYWKCFLMIDKWKGSVKTDIRLSSPACSKWQPKPVACVCGEVLSKDNPVKKFVRENELIYLCPVCSDRISKQINEIMFKNLALGKMSTPISEFPAYPME